jgi:hypothetical protein
MRSCGVMSHFFAGSCMTALLRNRPDLSRETVHRPALDFGLVL